MEDQNAAIHEVEKQALIGDRDSIIRIISAFRKLRIASEKLLSLRYRDGECDGVALVQFESDLYESLEDCVNEAD